MNNFSKKFHMVSGKSLIDMEREFPVVPSSLPPAPDPELDGLKPTQRNIYPLPYKGQDLLTVASSPASPGHACGRLCLRCAWPLGAGCVGHTGGAPSPAHPQPVPVVCPEAVWFPHRMSWQMDLADSGEICTQGAPLPAQSSCR